MLNRNQKMTVFTERITRCTYAIEAIRGATDEVRRLAAMDAASEELAALEQAANSQSGTVKATLQLICLQFGNEIQAAVMYTGPSFNSLFEGQSR